MRNFPGGGPIAPCRARSSFASGGLRTQQLDQRAARDGHAAQGGAGGRRVPGMRLGALTTSRPVRGRGQGRTPRGTLGPPAHPPPSSPSPAAQGAREAQGGRDRLRSRVSGARTRAGRRAPPTRPRPRRSAVQTRSQREPTCAKTLTASHCNNDRKGDRSVVRHFH